MNHQKLKNTSTKQLLLPLLEYCSAIWDLYHHTSISKLEMIQHRAARFVLTNTGTDLTKAMIASQTC